MHHDYALIAVPRPWVKPWLWSWFSAVSGAWPLPWLVVRQPFKWIFTTEPPGKHRQAKDGASPPP
jgi:hypothetical protein